MSFANITAWSYSRWSTYEQCPQRARFLYIDKMKEPGSPAMDRGTAIHTEAEQYLTGVLDKDSLPASLIRMRDTFRSAREHGPMCELSLAFTKDWTETSWFGADAWLRVKVDAVFSDGETCYIVDHKTGKINETHKGQLSLYALAFFTKYFDEQSVTTQLWYLDHGTIIDEKFKRRHYGDLRKYWLSKTKAMLSDTTYAPRPSNSCRWCHFRKENGGPCQF